ncbi:hypothetical protein T265_07646 [Opisthorchis viverrini]|uniref:Uncharacterized protein n=1 Tax=Opisthorchis viverrini TaxID=6198 RepID=A0A074ZN47_OPIVI|nr:hypothetical protein T265_07646 [Opisthorchis viverrini]KER24760.1 hypothetical protein T265_07646 [Opisthorchis viverrini]
MFGTDWDVIVLEGFGKQSVDLLLDNVSLLTQKLRQAKRAKPVMGCRRVFSNLMSSALQIYIHRDISNIVATET